MQNKYWFFSKTIWIAIIQAVIGIITAIQATPETQAIGGLLFAKSFLDIWLRHITTDTIATKKEE